MTGRRLLASKSSAGQTLGIMGQGEASPPGPAPLGTIQVDGFEFMESPLIRPGNVSEGEASPRVIAHFRNAAQGNLAIQLVVGLGVPADRLGVTSPDRIEGNQGMLLSIPCPDPTLIERVTTLCQSLGADVHRQRP